MEYVSRAGLKINHALKEFNINVKGFVCADFGSNVGGFVDVLIKNGAKKVYSIDTSYGTLDWNLRNNPKVVVLERTNAMHVQLPELCDLITVDVGWTAQNKILPNTLSNLKSNGVVVSLVKPHYEATKYNIKLTKGVVQESDIATILKEVEIDIQNCGFTILNSVTSPVTGKHGGNKEFLYLLAPFEEK